MRVMDMEPTGMPHPWCHMREKRLGNVQMSKMTMSMAWSIARIRTVRDHQDARRVEDTEAKAHRMGKRAVQVRAGGWECGHVDTQVAQSEWAGRCLGGMRKQAGHGR